MTPESTTIPFEIRTDETQRLLAMTLRGTWDVATFDAFAAAFLDAIESLKPHGGVTHQLVDATDFPLQPPEIAELFAPLIQTAHYPDYQRTACVIPELVNRIQARPGGNLVNARYFRTHEDATSWLFSEEA